MIINKQFPTLKYLLVDVLVCIIGVFISYLIFENDLNINFEGVFIYIFFRSVFFILFNTQKSSLKFQNKKDLQNLFFAIFLGGSFLYIFSLLFLEYSLSIYLDWKFYIIESSLSFNLLFLSRFILFKKKSISKKEIDRIPQKNIVIYGANTSGIKLLETIAENPNSPFNVVAIIDYQNKLVGKIIHQVRVVSSSYIEQNHIKDDIQLVIFTDDNLDTRVVDLCYQYQIDILEVPPLESWLNKKPDFKKININQLLGRSEIKIKNPKIENQISDNVVLITGAAGSIGTELAKQISYLKPSKLILLDQWETGLYELDYVLNNNFSNYDLLVCDICNTKRLHQVFKKYHPQIIFHAAAYKHVPLMEENPLEAIETNVFGSINLILKAIEYNVDTFVFISTDKAVNPTNIMGATKRATEMYIQSLPENVSTKFVSTRFGNVLGSNGSVIPLFEKQIAKGGPITITDKRITRFFMTINEACQLVLEASVMGEKNEVFVFDMGESVNIIDLARKMIYLSGLKENIDIEIKEVGLRPGEKLFEELLAKEENTLRTHHPKILIGKTPKFDRPKVTENFILLEKAIEESNVEGAVKLLKKIVPEFISNNSIFEKFD